MIVVQQQQLTISTMVEETSTIEDNYFDQCKELKIYRNGNLANLFSYAGNNQDF